MGGTSSKSKSEMITDIITNVAVKDIQDCSQFIDQNQNVYIQGSGNITSGIKMVQSAQINMDCYKKSKNITDLQNNIKAQVDQQVKATGSGFPTLDAGTHAEAYSKIQNDITSNINIDLLQKCAASVNQAQSVQVIGNRNITTDIAMDQTATMFKKCMTDAINQSTLGNDIQNFVGQNAQAETKSPFSFITDIFGGMFNTILLIVGAIVLIIVVAMVGGGGGGGDSGDYQPEPQQQQPQIYMMAPPPQSYGPGTLAAAPMPYQQQSPYGQAPMSYQQPPMYEQPAQPMFTQPGQPMYQ